MLYTVGAGSKSKALKLATIQAITSALDIQKILDWRKTPSEELPVATLRESYEERYSYVGNRCNAESITPASIARLAELTENTLLLFEEPSPGDCKRHSDLAMPLVKRGVEVTHIFTEEMFTASEFQRSLDEDDGYEMTEWRPAPAKLGKLPDVPVTINKPTSAIDNAICIAVQRGVLGNTRKVSVAAVETEAEKAMLRLSKMLIDSPELKAVSSLDGEIKKYLGSMAVPSALPHTKSVFFVPLGLVQRVQQRMAEFAATRKGLVAAVVAAYPQRVTEAQLKLKEFGDLSDYLTSEKVADQFYFDWQWLQFGAADKLAKIDSALFKQEQQRVERQWAEATAFAQQALRASMAKLVNHMVDRLSGTEDGKAKRFNDSTITNINEFLAMFDARNITNDAALKTLVDRAKQIVKGIDPDVLKTSDTARAYVVKGFEQIREKLDGLMVAIPRRAYRFDEE